MRNLYGWAILAVVVQLLASGSALAALAGLERKAMGLTSPVFATQAPGDPNRLFVTEQGGDIKIVDLATNTVTGTFLDILDTDAAGEGGLLGLAFHPDYADPDADGFRKFYVYVTVDNEIPEGTSPFTSRIREYKVREDNPNEADPSTVNEVLSFTQPQSNHNAGWIGFSPVDGYLYISSGDGGGSHDNDAGHTADTGNSQDRSNNLLGKMLRIDVNSDDFTADEARDYAIPDDNPFVSGPGDPLDDRDDEIWAYGLRNPFRDSFDRITGDLWIADVGQGQREEIDVMPPDGGTNRNFGWRLREGNIATDGGVGGAEPADYLPPIYDYTRGTGTFQGEAVTGGYRYRGPDPDLQGLYFFGDSDFKHIWTLDPPEPIAAGGTVTNLTTTQLGTLFNSVNRIVSFAEDANGNMYVVDYGTFGSSDGEVYKILTNNSLDGDYNLDGYVDAADYTVWRNHFGENFPNADGDGSGMVGDGDYDVWAQHYGESVHDPGGGGLVGVPEPATIALLGLVALGAIGVLRHRRF